MTDAELRTLAEDATPGPWDPMRSMGADLAMRRPVIPLRDAQFIAAANPQTVLALLDRLEAVYLAHDHHPGDECDICRALDGTP